jgi:hypothetical protein
MSFKPATIGHRGVDDGDGAIRYEPATSHADSCWVDAADGRSFVVSFQVGLSGTPALGSPKADRGGSVTGTDSAR